ncbi:enoyl-CoA hydratase [Paracandidimonas lactea]|uniref:enoyl-CoA hydratase n=1 Tax=Paracandidimonas lactea TaxID=2895524 RepID=UPI001EFFD818|nr:enoyl-CoA hydratase [Paracandidimonas lactea]
MEMITIDKHGVATLIINNGGPLNIISSRVARELTQALRALAEDSRVRVLVIRGTGVKTFVGGADIKEMQALDPASARTFITALYELCEAVRLFPRATIAHIQGWCIGVGLELAACCDMRYATHDAQFTMPEVKIGIPSVIQGALLARLIGEGRARWLMLSGRAIDASTAMAWGLLNEIGDTDEMAAIVADFAAELASHGETGMRKQKELLIDWEAPYLQKATRDSIGHFGQAFESDEPGNYMREFFEARKKG